MSKRLMSKRLKSMYRAFLNNGFKLATQEGFPAPRGIHKIAVCSDCYGFALLEKLNRLGWEYRLLKEYGIFNKSDVMLGFSYYTVE